MVETNPRIDRLRHEVDAVGPEALETFWAETAAVGTPLVEPLGAGTALVTFLWRGEAQTTSVEWGVHLSLERLSGTDLWHGSLPLPDDLRTVYYLAHDGTTDVPKGPGAGPTHIDPVKAYRSLDKIKSLAEKHDAEIFFSHDAGAYAHYLKAPAWYV